MMTRSQTRIAQLEEEKEFYKDLHEGFAYKLFLKEKELQARIVELEKENETLKKEKEETVEDEQPKSTKNTKDNRLCVKVKYYEPYAVFNIPNGLDLEDKSIVNEWYVKYGTLYICYTNGKEKEIEWDNISNEDFDYKSGTPGEYRDGKIVSADNYFFQKSYDDESTDEDTDDEDE